MMLNILFPKQIDNNYQGSSFAIVILALITIVKLLMGINIGGFNPFIPTEYILSHVDGVPLDTYPKEAAQTIISMAQSWGLDMLIISCLSILIMVKYRAAIPIMFVIYLCENFIREAPALMRILKNFLSGTPLSTAAIINLSLIAFLFIGLILSIYNPLAKRDKQRQKG